MPKKKPYIDKSPFTAIGVGYNIDPDDDRANNQIDKDLDNFLKEEGIKATTTRVIGRPDYLK
tara:strand:- start:1763 stop:1948 length:186 start_codon:yes stop_codon:yes gene_type:complete